ncbi:hypothetical protein PYW08_011373 [Mythimna loreyi]|uniref:Uncharacterized protein n=1 Tax=Mythimna loreyi TaxID=667449 RepID=A0ACC2Q3A6_9NEOP|nr:hypothetical protein PYW08_011373 [Mythimna loreyi]
MYWEQLELRCRSLYRPSAGQAAPSAGRQVQSNCSCCTQCHPTQPAWDISLQHRFWAPGRIGNLYSPNPGTGRKTSAWSWFPWPRSNSQNSRCRMGVPQSGDSAYGFCDTEAPPPAQAQAYDDRYPHSFPQTPFTRAQSSGTFAQGTSFGQGQGNFAQGQGNFVQGQGNFPQPNFSGEGFGEASGSFDAATGVWGPPPPYSPQGRSGSRHHLHHQDPAAATLLHHHHIEHRTTLHDHPTPIQPHTCTRNSYHIQQHMPPNDMRMTNPELARINPELARINPELARINPELARINPELARINPELAEFARLNPELARLNPELARLNPELAHMGLVYPQDVAEMARLQAELAHMPPEARFNTLRGHLVPYRCQRLGMSASNLHRDCRIDDNVTIECLHQKTGSKVSDQSTLSDSCPKQGKENLGFQNDKHSPIRSSMQDCRAASNQNAESEVYFADVSSCCNVSVKADCCMNANVSALVGTIENHPESTSESDTGSFTLTRQQRPQPQVGSKRRPRQADKHMKNQEKMRQVLNNSIRLTEHQIEQLNNSMRMNERIERDRMNETRLNERMNDSRDRLSDRERIERMNDVRISDRMNETRLSERMNDSRDRLNDGRVCERMERLNDSRISDRMNDSRISDRMNETRMSERMNESRDRLNDSRSCEVMDPRIERMNDSRISDRMNETRLSERLNDSRVCERMAEARLERMNDSKLSDRSDTRHSDRMNDSRLERMNDSRLERMSDINSSIRIDGSPKMRSHISPLRIARSSPKNVPKDHPRQSSSDSNKPDFRQISPLSPNTEESLLSDDDRPQDTVYSNDPETSKCLGPDSQYEPVRDGKEEILKTNHHHCYSDTNTMDSGWQSGSEKQVTD